MIFSTFRSIEHDTVVRPAVDDTYRVMVVGDSLTYGSGIAEESRFSNLVERWLEGSFSVELINLGSPGHQSEDVLAVVEKYLPVLRPNSCSTRFV
jgi:hypothetical protein